MRVLPALWFFVTLVLPLVRGAEAQDGPPPPLRVMSFNIRYGTAGDGENHWDRRREFLVETIQKFGPDLLGTQETLEFQKDYLVERLEGYSAVGVGRDDGRGAGEMTALFYRTSRFVQLESGHFWLSETPDVPGSKNWDAAITRMATWVKLRDEQNPDAPTLYFFNTHFDHIGRESRYQSARLIRRRIESLPDSPPVIITGDFNEGESSRTWQALFDVDSSAGPPLLRDSYRLAHPQRRVDEATFNGFNVTRVEGDRIDWIGCTRDFRVTSAEIDRSVRDGRAPSDHYPVTAVLEPSAQ